MNYFINLQTEECKKLAFSNFLRNNLNQRINMRGHNEQYSAKLRDQNFVDVAKRLCKGTYTKGCEFFSKYL